MKVKLTAEFKFSEDGINIITKKAGDTVEGDIAKSAVAQGKAKAKPSRSAKKEPLDNKSDQPDLETGDK